MTDKTWLDFIPSESSKDKDVKKFLQNQAGFRRSSDFTVDVKNDGFIKARFCRLHNDLPPKLVRDFANEA